MIESMQKHMNVIMWIILVVLIVSFLFFGLFAPAGGSRAAAVVNGDVVTVMELNRTYRNLSDTYRRIFKDQFTDKMAKNLRMQALRDLVQDRLLVQEAKRVGMRVSDREVQAAIMATPAFQIRGRFSKEQYDRYLDYVNEKPRAFEESQRDAMLRRKLENVIEQGVDVTNAELKAAYRKRHPKAKAGDFAKNLETFRQSYLAEKQQDALEAAVEKLFKEGKVTIHEGEVAAL